MANSLLNFFSGGLTEQPAYNPVPLDAGTDSIINQETAQGNLSPQQLEQMELQGTSPTMPSATGGAVANQQTTLGGAGDASVGSALDARANRLYDSQYNQLNAQAVANAPAMQGGMMNNASQALQAQQNIGNQINAQQMQVIANQNALRSKVVGQLFSGAGAFAGGMMGGRQAAAMQGIQGSLNNMNDPNSGFTPGYAQDNPAGGTNYSSDPNAAYNLTGDASSAGAPSLDVPMNNFSSGTGPYGYGNPGQDGNGYYGNTPPNIGYGLGFSTNGTG